jgi:anaerobic selenocysteine-containing dehydrogenase
MCSKGLAFQQLVYHPDRITHPKKRVGNKGEGKWQRISWDEALDTIAAKYKKIKEEYGAEAIVLGTGTGRNNEHWLNRFGFLLGTPNVIGPGHICYGPRVVLSPMMCGHLPVSDYAGNPECIMVWGSNMVWTSPDEYKAEGLTRVLSQGAKLIVVDPRLTYLASRADIWLQLRPGTDTALAVGMANVMVNEGLYDKEFVERYVYGWDKFTERVKDYPTDKVEEITWVPGEKIREAARLYAQIKPACIQWGVAIEQTLNCSDNVRTLIALMAITGNLDVPGGNVFYPAPPKQSIGNFVLYRKLPPEQQAKRLGGSTYRVADKIGVVTPKLVWDAILTGKPYSVKAIQFHASNPVVTRNNANEVYRALSQVEFMVVTDFFLTPTAELADIVLPAATWLEKDDIGDYWQHIRYIYPRKKIVQIGECRSDAEIFMELGKRLGQEQYWRDSVEDELDYMLEPSGLSWKEFCQMDYLEAKMVYRKHENRGFSTPTKKVELYSTIMEKLGYDPLPQYREIPESPVSKPEMASQYPYILITGARSPVFFHSEHRMIPWLRELHPDPIVEIHPQTAKRHGIKDGDWVFIESPRGRIKQRAKLTAGVDPRIVAAQHGWWFPEIKTPDHGWNKANINILTEDDPKGYDLAMGSTNTRVLICNICPVDE